MIVGIVAEGVNDYPVMKEFLRELYGADNIHFVELQPTPDATGEYQGGGWSRVLGWCLDCHGSNIETFFVPIVEGEEGCDLILIHLDGDAMDHCAPHSSLPCPQSPCEPRERVSAIKDMVSEWLEPPDEYAQRIICAVPTMHSEAWIIEGLEPRAREWEKEEDCKNYLRKNYFAKHAKNSSEYERLTREAATELDSIRSESVSFRDFITTTRDAIRNRNNSNF